MIIFEKNAFLNNISLGCTKSTDTQHKTFSCLLTVLRVLIYLLKSVGSGQNKFRSPPQRVVIIFRFVNLVIITNSHMNMGT